MSSFVKPIEAVDLTCLDESRFVHRYVGCIVLTQDFKILLQERGLDWHTFPGCLSTFGGSIEAGESPLQALRRELKEELGAQVQEAEIVQLGAITEALSQYRDLIYVYFWQDKRGTITGCYEGEAKAYEQVEAVLEHPKLMDDVRWLLSECQKRQLL